MHVIVFCWYRVENVGTSTLAPQRRLFLVNVHGLLTYILININVHTTLSLNCKEGRKYLRLDKLRTRVDH